MTSELSGSQNLPTSWAMSPMLGCEQDWGGRMCAAKRGRHLNMSLPLEGKQGFQGIWASTSFKKTSSFLNWEEKLFLPGAMSPQIDYISESPGTLGETQIPKYQSGLNWVRIALLPLLSPRRGWENRNPNSSQPLVILMRWLTKLHYKTIRLQGDLETQLCPQSEKGRNQHFTFCGANILTGPQRSVFQLNWEDNLHEKGFWKWVKELLPLFSHF